MSVEHYDLWAPNDDRWHNTAFNEGINAYVPGKVPANPYDIGENKEMFEMGLQFASDGYNDTLEFG